LIYFPKRPQVRQLNRILLTRYGVSYGAKKIAPRKLREPQEPNRPHAV
jgi:hypothetical protein